MIIPRIEATPIFSGSPPGEARRREYLHYRCNDTYYHINYEAEALGRCLELIHAAGTFVHDGSDRMY